MIESISIESGKPGPHLLILGAIHGNETCGTYAIKKVIDEIHQGVITLKRWCITGIPICNPKAYKNKVRYVEKNLNRVFMKHHNPLFYEEHLANQITSFVEKCDYVLDIHSMQSQGKSFIFQDYDDEATSDMCQHIGVPYIIRWRAQLNTLDDHTDTIGYAHTIWKIWVLVECGQHNDDTSKKIAYQAIMNVLIRLWMISNKKIPSKRPVSIKVNSVVIKTQKWNFSQSRKHWDLVDTNQLLAVYEDGQRIISGTKGFILLPNEKAKTGEERFYIGE